MRTSRSSVVMPFPVRHALRKLGRDIRDARRRRRIPAAIAAQRASISRTTLVKIEKGDPGVAIGRYATVLFVLGMADRLGDLAAPKNDPGGPAARRRKSAAAHSRDRADRNARKKNDGQRSSRIRRSRRRPAPDGAAVGRVRARTRRAPPSNTTRAGWTIPRGSLWSRPCKLGPGPFHTPADTPMFGAIGDSAPDRWGRALMRRMERRRAEREGGAPRTLQEIDFLLLVDDEARQGALRFAEKEGGPVPAGGGRQAHPAADRTPETALRRRTRHGGEGHRGGSAHAVRARLLARRRAPQGSVREKDGHLAIAKFPRKDDEINTVVWEAVALALAQKAGIPVPAIACRKHRRKACAPAATLRPRRRTAYSVPLRHEHARIERQRRREAIWKLSTRCASTGPRRKPTWKRCGGGWFSTS